MSAESAVVETSLIHILQFRFRFGEDQIIPFPQSDARRQFSFCKKPTSQRSRFVFFVLTMMMIMIVTMHGKAVRASQPYFT